MRIGSTLKASALAIGASLVLSGSALAAGVSGPAFYVDGRLYRTVGTPTDFSHTGAPAHSYDVIYDFGGIQRNVATAAPRDPGFNGGRWMVHALGVSDYAGALADPSVDINGNDVIDSDEEILAGLATGYWQDNGVVRQFECPVVPLPSNQQP